MCIYSFCFQLYNITVKHTVMSYTLIQMLRSRFVVDNRGRKAWVFMGETDMGEADAGELYTGEAGRRGSGQVTWVLILDFEVFAITNQPPFIWNHLFGSMKPLLSLKQIHELNYSSVCFISVCIFVYVHCVYGCMCACSHMESRGWHQVSSIISPLLFPWSSLTDQQIPGIPCVCSPVRGL